LTGFTAYTLTLAAAALTSYCERSVVNSSCNTSAANGPIAVTEEHSGDLLKGSYVAVLQTELMDRRRWIDRETFTLAFGLARLTPGTNLLAFAVGIGWLLRGFSGVLSALLAGSIPCSLIALLVTALYETWSRNPFVQTGLRGALAAAVGVMVATGWTLIRPFWNETSLPRSLLLIGGAMFLALRSISPIQILLLSACVGILWPEREPA
jgi:chromate transporter